MPERLHLDLSAGARGEMIAGALLGVGAERRAADDALLALGLDFVDLDVEPVRRGGLVATRVRFVVDGAELAAPAARARRGRPLDEQRRRHAVAKPRLHEASRAPLRAAKTGAAVEDAPAAGRTGPGLVVDDANAGAGRGRRARPARRRRAPGAAEAWRAGADARPADLVALVRGADLPPVTKALALQALRRAVDALSAVAGPEARLAGPWALRLLCEIATAAALLDGLSPALVTASPVAVSSAAAPDDGVAGVIAQGWPRPSPWLLEVLAGVPVLELDDDVAVSDVGGAAVVAACVHRFGARGLASATRQACGAGAVDAPGAAVVARALLGPPAPLSTRAGDRAAHTLCELSAVVPLDADREALAEELAAAGARAPRVVDAAELAAGPAGSARARGWLVSAALPVTAVERAVSILWRAGAVDVKSSWVEILAPALVEVTVPVGRGRTRAGVRVRAWKDGEDIARIEADVDDVRAAADKRGGRAGGGAAQTAAVAAEAVAGFARITGGGGVEGDDEG